MFPGYFVFGYPGPETDALPDREYHGIAKNLVMFSKRRYEMTGAGVYWLSDTPLVGGSSSWGTARPRHVNWVRLRDRRSGREFRVLSLHLDHISHEARLAQVRAVEEETSQYPAGVPQVLAGDFNSRLRTPLPGCLSVPAGSMRSSRPMAKMRSICRSTGSRAMPISRRRGRPGVSTTFS